jgi:hypothetical protein
MSQRQAERDYVSGEMVAPHVVISLPPAPLARTMGAVDSVHGPYAMSEVADALASLRKAFPDWSFVAKPLGSRFCFIVDVDAL